MKTKNRNKTKKELGKKEGNTERKKRFVILSRAGFLRQYRRVIAIYCQISKYHMFGQPDLAISFHCRN